MSENQGFLFFDNNRFSEEQSSIYPFFDNNMFSEDQSSIYFFFFFAKSLCALKRTEITEKSKTMHDFIIFCSYYLVIQLYIYKLIVQTILFAS